MKKFDSYKDFLIHLGKTLGLEKPAVLYEAYQDKTEVDENKNVNIYWLSEEFTINELACSLLSNSDFGETIHIKIEHDIDCPFEDEDGNTFYQRYLSVISITDDTIPFEFPTRK